MLLVKKSFSYNLNLLLISFFISIKLINSFKLILITFNREIDEVLFSKILFNSMKYYLNLFLLLSFFLLNAQLNSINFNENKSDFLNITAVGDMMIGTNYPSKSYLPPNDGKDIFKNVSRFLKNSDITFGNLEGVILSENIPTTKICNDPKKCYAFKMPDHYVNHFKDAGFNLLSIANNHINDFDTKGIMNTIELLKKVNINFAGTLDYPTAEFKVNGWNIGFCAFSPNRGTVSLNNTMEAVAIVKSLKQRVDIVIVSFHGGGEGIKFEQITNKTEYYLGENRGNPYQFSKNMIDAGADVVFGHGPHVTRAIDMYKGKIITYSMGNFATYGRFDLSGAKGIAPIIKFKINKKGDLVSGKIISIMQIEDGIPVLDKNKKVINKLQTLMNNDLINKSLKINDDGLFEINKQ